MQKPSMPLKRLSAAIACLLLSPSGYGQTLDEVVVTATGQAQTAFDAPASIQAVEQGLIQASGPQVNLSESLNRIPGVVVLNRQNYAQDLQLSVRGSGSRSPFGIRGSRLVVDGIPATMPDGQGQASTISLSSAQRIEVLRGPLAQLYGNSSAGVIQVYSVEGQEGTRLQSSLDSGPDGMQRWGVQAAGQAGGVAYMLDHSDFKTRGYRQHSAAERQHTNAKISTQATPNTRLTVVGNVFDMPLSLDPRGLDQAQLQRDRRQAGTGALLFNTGKEVKQQQLGLVVDTRVGADTELALRLYSGEREVRNRLGLRGNVDLQAGGIVHLDRQYHGTGLTVHRTLAVGEGAMTLSAGLEYETMEERRRGYVNNNGVRGDLRRDEDNAATSTGLFAGLDWRVNEGWSVLAGLRDNEVTFKIRDYYVVGDNPDDSGQVRFRSLNPVLGLTRHWGPDVNVYANYGQGLETPTLAEVAYQTGGSGPNLRLKPASADHYEVGIKAKPAPGHRLDWAYFDIRTQNEIVVESNAGGRSVFANAARTRRTGWELAHSAQWTPEWSSYVSIATLDARFARSVRIGGSNVPAGHRIPGTLNRQVYAEAVWKPAAYPGWTTQLELLHQGQMFADDANQHRTGSATVWAWRLGWERVVGAWQWRSYVRIDNLLDTDYVGSVIVNESSRRYYEPAPGRQIGWGVSLVYRF
jgi:iron complex outermembrane recepter protein